MSDADRRRMQFGTALSKDPAHGQPERLFTMCSIGRPASFSPGRRSSRDWAKAGLDAKGRPIEAEESRPTLAGVLIYPGDSGATNRQPPAAQRQPVAVLRARHRGRRGVLEDAAESAAQGQRRALRRQRDFDPAVDVGHPGARRRDGRAQVGILCAARSRSDRAHGHPRDGGQHRHERRPRDLLRAGRHHRAGKPGSLVGGGTYAPPITFLDENDKQVVILMAGRAIFAFGL